MAGHHHRSSGLKQSNKSHKSAKSSKRSYTRAAGGKIQGTTKYDRVGIRQNGGAVNVKANRMHMAQQRRLASKEKLLRVRRLQGRAGGGGGVVQVPRVVGLISLSEMEGDMECAVRDYVVGCSNCSSGGNGGALSSVTATYFKYKKEGHLTFLTNSTAFYPLYDNINTNTNTDDTEFTKENASVQAALDLSRVCDLVVFLLDGRDAISTSNTYDGIISSRGDRVLSAIKAQGLPTPLTVLVNIEADDDDDNSDDEMSINTVATKSGRSSALRKKVELKRYVSRFAATEFGERATKVLELDLPPLSLSKLGDGVFVSDIKQDITKTPITVGDDDDDDDDDDRSHPSRAAFLRSVCTMKATPPRWVSEMPRAYLLSDGNGTNSSNTNTLGYQYNASAQELQITGFIRGKAPWNVTDLAHLPNVGTFRVAKIERTRHPLFSTKRRGGKKNNNQSTADQAQLLAQRKEGAKCESLDMYANPDALDGEQNLIGFDTDTFQTMDDDNTKLQDTSPASGDAFQKGIARPVGWSDYQAAWIDAIPDNDDENVEDHGELAFALNKTDAAFTTTDNDMMTTTDAQNNTIEERKAHLAERLKDAAEERTFPDEVEAKEEEKAGDRFARYRSLKSFRKSYWDAKENLPTEYGRIFHFGCFRATQADVIRDREDVIEAAAAGGFLKGADDGADEAMCSGHGDSDDEDDLLEGCVPSGNYVTITLQSVPQITYSNIPSSTLLTAITLLPHEHKLSVLHMSLSQPLTCTNTNTALTITDNTAVKSKDPLTFRCGWRTWKSRPVFSQNNLNCDKQKFERFLPGDGAFFAASVLGPVTYCPCPVMVFRDVGEGGSGGSGRRQQLVAVGSMMGADADRIVVKRIILTGYPTRVHKRNATVKYMFYNPDDVNWFKPAGLTTKHGLQGNILDSIGDHGTMKCLFNAPIKQHDTVCLPLYKRIYPKYEPTEVMNEEGNVIRHDILVL